MFLFLFLHHTSLYYSPESTAAGIFDFCGAYRSRKLTTKKKTRLCRTTVKLPAGRSSHVMCPITGAYALIRTGSLEPRGISSVLGSDGHAACCEMVAYLSRTLLSRKIRFEVQRAQHQRGVRCTHAAVCQFVCGMRIGLDLAHRD
jgi:hypothetical protein